MIPKLTHTEACRMVEDAIERVGKTLAYIRLRLAENPNYMDCSGSEMKVKARVNEANLLCNINHYGAYISGAQAMYRAMERNFYLDYKKKQDWLISKAQLKLFMENTRNLDWFLHDYPKGVEIFTELERDKKGKVMSAKAKFVKKETKYTEI
ncbi:MAG: hypothetical protein K2M69_08195 [Muribaculaceae bacterium]|nr:hypothetical protein [Muribaculaceae bacterium]